MNHKPRPRRIAADEAHAWARNLRLGNPFAKLVLSMLTLYVDGDGCSYVSINQLAEDCELDPKTVRARLTWLERDARVIKRRPQWIAPGGGRNSDGIGRQTTDAMQLLVFDEEKNTTNSATNISGPSGGTPPSGRASESTESVSPTVGTPLGLHLRSPPESFEPEPEPKKEGGGGSAREAAVLISPEAHAFADEMATISGHNPEFLPPQWVSAGPALRVQMMLDHGWRIETMRETAKATMQHKRDGPPSTIRYFEKIFARAHVAQAPLPEASNEQKNAQTPDRHPQDWRARRDRQHEALADLRAYNDAVRERKGGGGGGTAV